MDSSLVVAAQRAGDAGAPPFPWTLLPLGVLMCIGLALTLSWYFWPLSVRQAHVGGGMVFPRVELSVGERVDARYRASLVRNDRGRDNEVGWLVITSLRAIFVPSNFPWEHKAPMIIEFSEILNLEQDRIPSPVELGPFGTLLRVRGLRMETNDGSVWFGKPNTGKIERALRSHTGL